MLLRSLCVRVCDWWLVLKQHSHSTVMLFFLPIFHLELLLFDFPFKVQIL